MMSNDFPTDLRNALVREFPNRTVVISPADPSALAAHLLQVVPGVEAVGPVGAPVEPPRPQSQC